MSLPTTKVHLNVTTGPLLASYKSSPQVDAASFYCPYVPLSASRAAMEYWRATDVYDTYPFPLVVIDGSYALQNSRLVRATVEKWIVENAVGGFYWEEDDSRRYSPEGMHLPQCDLLRLTHVDDAVLFRLKFSDPQTILP